MSGVSRNAARGALPQKATSWVCRRICCHDQAPTAAACRSMPQRQILGAVGGGFEACRSMPQHAAASQNFHMVYFFFHNMSNL